MLFRKSLLVLLMIVLPIITLELATASHGRSTTPPKAGCQHCYDSYDGQGYDFLVRTDEQKIDHCCFDSDGNGEKHCGLMREYHFTCWDWAAGYPGQYQVGDCWIHDQGSGQADYPLEICA